MPFSNQEDRRRYQREFIAARRQAWVDKQGGCCVKCGSIDSLEIDHIDPALKSMPVGTLWSRTLEVRETELAKCQVLCRECHRVKTYGQLKVKHGTPNAYKHHKCRCQDCRDANAAAVTRQRERKRGHSDGHNMN